MKVCDKCRAEKAKTYKYESKLGVWSETDLCINCLQTVVLEKQSRLIEVNQSTSQKGLLNG
jgi:hypothetical protein